MFLKATVSQGKFMLRQKKAWIVFYILLAMVLVNFVTNVLMFRGMDSLAMYQPMKLLLLSWNKTMSGGDLLLGFLQIYPLLVICPAVFSLAEEQQSKEYILLSARLGNMKYRFSKLLAVFGVTFLIFTLPFFIEIILNCLAFPLNAQGDLSNWNYYDPTYIESVNNYLFSKIFLMSPYLSAVLGTILFGIASGIFAAFTTAFSSVVRFRYRIFLFLPIFILLNLTEIVSSILFRRGMGFRLSWYHYCLLYNDEPKNVAYFLILMSILILLTIGGMYIGGKKDCMS